MTTVPGHNFVIQQSGTAQELTHQVHAPKPSPEQAAVQQAANEQIKNTTVQGFDESEKLNIKKDNEKFVRSQRLKRKKKKKKKAEVDDDPGATGRLLDTMV